MPIRILALLLLSSPLLAQDVWTPDRTWVFVVGVLEWQDSESWSSFPKEDRRDEALVEHFKTAGVPGDRIVYLQDRRATRARIDEEFGRLLASTREGDLLFVYYCGHGYREGKGKVWFVPWDAGDDMDRTAWPVRSIFDAIEKDFRGERAWLLSDCCHSGALCVEAKRRAESARISYGCLAASLAREASTGEWTFTDALLSGLRGEAEVDRDDNGRVTFQELASHVEDEMAFFDGQRASWAATGSFDPAHRVADARPARHARIGERVEVLDEGDWYRAKILDAKDGTFLVHYAGYSSDEDEWVGPDRIRDYRPEVFAAGAAVEVEWKGEWYPARVLEDKDGVHLVRYDGYGEEWDEWVGAPRIRPASER